MGPQAGENVLVTGTPTPVPMTPEHIAPTGAVGRQTRVGTTLRPMSTPPLLVCPACREQHGGSARIGNRKSTCKLCNRFYQAVRRLSAKLLADLHPSDASNATTLAQEQIYLEMVGSADA